MHFGHLNIKKFFVVTIEKQIEFTANLDICHGFENAIIDDICVIVSRL